MAVRLCGLAVLAVGVGAFAPAARRPPRALPVASASVSDAATISEIEGKENLLRTLDENADKLVVVKYFASWCRSCRSMKPRFERVASDWGARARFFEAWWQGAQKSAPTAAPSCSYSPVPTELQENVGIHKSLTLVTTRKLREG